MGLFAEGAIARGRQLTLRRWLTVFATALIAASLLAGTPAAHAATQIGATFDPNECQNAETQLQGMSPGNQYAAPTAGVITAWSFQADGAPPQLEFKVARFVSMPSSNNFIYTIVGESDLKTPLPNQVNTYTDIRVPVQPGDVIGFRKVGTTGNHCSGSPAPGYFLHFLMSGDPSTGTTTSFMEISDHQLDLSAVLEPDCDNDGFGDETQDSDISSCSVPEPQAVDVNAPNAAITSGPRNKTRRREATFTFTGVDARAVASFQCSLDGAAFAPCTSPHTVRVKKGKHTFQVRAIDDSGNVGSPASDDWKRKKKRRR